jgi:hypothetical protein
MPAFAADCIQVCVEDISIRSDTGSSLCKPERQTESCPNDLKPTDFILLYLYQISSLQVKKNRRLTDAAGLHEKEPQMNADGHGFCVTTKGAKGR